MAEKRISADEGLRATELVNRQILGLGIQQLFDSAECVNLAKSTTFDLNARVAKLADARDLKSRVLNRTYRFNSGPGHQTKPFTCNHFN